MAFETISQVTNKYIIGKETNYGVEPESLTQLDFGLVQSISISEDESLIPVPAINTGHTLATIEDGLYVGSITITSNPTRAGLINLLEALFGDYDADTPTEGKYTITTDPKNSDDLSYFLKVKDNEDKIWNISGIHLTEGTITVSKGAITQISLTGGFKSAEKDKDTIDPETNIDQLFTFLDSYVTMDGETKNLNDFNVSINWNRNAEDSRGVEAVTNGERRLIQRIIRHSLTLSGSFSALLDQDNTGYVEERTPSTLVFVMSRGENTHTFTITGVKTTNRTNEQNVENGLKTYSADYTAVDCSVVGDIFSES